MRIVPLVDLLATLHTPVDADVLVIDFDDGSSCALAIAEEIRTPSSWLAVGDGVRLRSPAWPPSRRSDVITAIRAMSFSTFVGAS